ncbi:glycosyltransferase family 39 protein [Adhaeribacter radiodurans]|uniref:Glycosyltransferase family 39 protein n=1 Tax=Adhaeribacter radiodurans TaxID=2745197 RepID=A0A7L7L301_9BACT|nr:glycosyltransferase family 39 protein [Adhaeribacter radiodurans]QMU27176.1 glycosyltransferase family 39 protein [Adhaeribacter radiodurans]
MFTKTDQLFRPILLFLVIFKFTLAFFSVHPAYQLQRDEYLYLDEANHLAWGFVEVPPALAVQAWITKALGNYWFLVRFWPALFGAITMWVIGLTVKRLGGSSFALALVGIGFLASAYLRINILFQPNALEFLFWSVYLYLLICYIQQPKASYLYLLGVAIGLGLLNKYSVIFFLAGTCLALLLSPQRTIFRQKHFYGALLIAVIILLPNLIWQVQHNIPFWQHMQELKKTQLDLVKPKDFLLDQLLMNFPALFIWLAGLLALFFTKWARPYRLIGWIYLSVIAIFLLLHGKSYYALGLYPILLAFGGVAWEQLLTQKWQRQLKPVLLLLPLILVAPLVPLLLPILSPKATAQYCQKFKATGILRWEDGQDHLLPQDYADMLGWSEMARLVRKAYTTIPMAERAETIIWCDNYGEAGAVNFYNLPYNLPRAHSTSASYALWFPPLVNPKILILVSENAPTELQAHFKSVQIIGRLNNPLYRENNTHVSILRQPNATILQSWNAEITAEKQKFGVK